MEMERPLFRQEFLVLSYLLSTLVELDDNNESR